jgi:diguanylate cyclase (GGDEF)-like protein
VSGPGAGLPGDDTIGTTEPVVLLADERVDVRETIAFHLAMAGFPVVQAGSFDAVVDELHRGRPDVVVVADDLGGGGVEDLLVTITKQPELDGVPVITLSEDPTSGRLAACLALGARDHVRRQDGAEELIARIDAVLRVDDELERLRRRNAELEFLAAIDPLTGMANRRGIEEELDRLAAGAIRHHLPLSVVMARLDDFGTDPTVRDHVRREVGYLVGSARRTDDFAGAWDGRTFALLLPMTPLAGAKAFASRLHAVVGAAPVRHEDGAVPVTLSCAYAQVRADVEAVFPALETAVSLVQAAGGDAVTPA